MIKNNSHYFKRIILLFYGFIIIISITSDFFLKNDIKVKISDSYDYKFLFGFLLIYLLLILLFLKYYKISLLNYSRLRNDNKLYINLFMILLVYQVLQSIFFSDLRALLIIPKYLFYFLFIFLGITLGGINNKRNLTVILKYTSIFIIFSELLYTRVVISTNHFSLAFREFRPQILFGNANEDGGLIASLFPILLISNIRNKKLVIFIILFFIVFYNGSKASIISMFISVIVYLYFYSNKKIVFRTISSLFVIFILTKIIVSSPDSISLEKRFKDSFFSIKGIYNAWNNIDYYGSMGVRLGNVWAPMIKHTLHNSPLFGFGNGSWKTESINVGLKSKNLGRISYRRSPHNVFLVYFVDWGLFGLLIMLWFYYFNISLCYRIFKDAKITDDVAKYALSGLLCWIGYFSWAFSANAHSWGGWLVFSFLSIYVYLINELYHENSVDSSVSDK